MTIAAHEPVTVGRRHEMPMHTRAEAAADEQVSERFSHGGLPTR